MNRYERRVDQISRNPPRFDELCHFRFYPFQRHLQRPSEAQVDEVVARFGRTLNETQAWVAAGMLTDVR